MKRIVTFIALFFTVFLAVAQDQSNPVYQNILTSLDTLRCEVKKTHTNGKTERAYYYDKAGKFVKVANFSKEGKLSSTYLLKNEKKKEFIKFYVNTGLKKRHSYYHENEAIAVSIFYDFTETVENIFFKNEDGKERFEVMVDLTNGGFSKRIFNSNGILIRRIDQVDGNISKAYYYNGKLHGFIISIDKEGKKNEEFWHKGMAGKYYEGWEKIIDDFDKIPALEKELDAELIKYNIVLDDSLGKGIKIKFKDN